jgi:alpha,alpha-trehalase
MNSPATRARRISLTLLRACAILWAVALCGPAAPSHAQSMPPKAQLDELRAYIKKTWTTLTRSLADVPAAARDPKMHRPDTARWPLYISRLERRARVERALASALSESDRGRLELRLLPSNPADVTDHGLLYLPRPYVVPGGRFNEMYGWDSYFIQVGLLGDGEVELARDMVDNFVYEIDKYGTILNANRTYYLSRSQPPFLTRMILGVYERTRDRDWLRSSLPAIERYYRFWTSGAHLNAATGLSRYFDTGKGPAPEVLADERDQQGRTHYDRVREFYKTHPVTDYELSQYYDAASDQLTPLFYTGDRSMRESGFDPSNRYVPFSVDIIHYVPVCLNSLLYQMEEDGAAITAALGRASESRRWRDRAARRKTRIDLNLWDADTGVYFDYNFLTKQRRRYLFATTFYPLWAGTASAEQARRVREHLAEFEAPGGILTSTTVTGSQWDAPFGWAPLQMIAVEGLRRYGFGADADRLATKFVSMVNDDFREHGVIVEKYDVRRRKSDVAAGIKYGYSANQVGFGWTNAAIVQMLSRMGQQAPVEEPVAVPR